MGLASVMNNKDDKCVFEVAIEERTNWLVISLFIDHLLLSCLHKLTCKSFCTGGGRMTHRSGVGLTNRSVNFESVVMPSAQ